MKGATLDLRDKVTLGDDLPAMNGFFVIFSILPGTIQNTSAFALRSLPNSGYDGWFRHPGRFHGTGSAL
jgi:hypothetical protein